MNELNTEQKNILLNIARTTVESFIRTGKVEEYVINDEELKERRGVFVTIHKNGKLRGCIGQIIPSEKPLWQAVSDMAISACCEDSRFDPVFKEELSELGYEVSVLSVPERIDNWQHIELGKHGVIVRKGTKMGVFLPQVATETGWTKEELLDNLCESKAGLGSSCYKDSDVDIEVFTAQVFSEKK